MLVAVPPEQDGVLAVFNRRKVFALEVGEIKADRVFAGRKPREIGSRQPNLIAVFLHLALFGMLYLGYYI